jgi:cell wall assembly regulator SMI1
MNPLIEFLEQIKGTVLVNEDGVRSEVRLLPPLSAQELATLSEKIPCPIPPEIRALLAFARGFEGTWLGEVEFGNSAGPFGLDGIFPHALELATDGAGNYWVVDLAAGSQSWGPIFYACHDAPVVVYQAESLLHFVKEIVRGANEPWQSEVNDVCGRLSDFMWIENPGVLSYAHCSQSTDQEIRMFAESLDESWQFIDLRNPVLGDGFSWGRYGPKTVVRRFGEKRLFAYQKKNIGRRIIDAFR